MLTPDMMNGLFEFGGGMFVLNHCRVAYADKVIRGVSLISVVYFFLWGMWNIYYYPHLDQMWSLIGGLFIVLANCIWIGLMFKYRKN